MTSIRPPNLLFLYTDEQRTDTLACGGALWEDFAVKATAADGRLTGTITARVPALEKQTELAGTAVRVRDDKRPADTFVLQLDKAVRESADRSELLYLNLITKDNKLVSVTASAPRTNKAAVQADASGLRLENGRLRGSMVAIFRPDLWVAVDSGAQGQQCASPNCADSSPPDWSSRPATRHCCPTFRRPT